MTPFSEPLTGEPIILSSPIRKSIVIWDISMAVSKVTGISFQQMRTKCRKRNIAEARQLFAYFGKGKFSLTKLGQHLWQDHATMIHGQKTINALLNQKGQETIHQFVREISSILYS